MSLKYKFEGPAPILVQDVGRTLDSIYAQNQPLLLCAEEVSYYKGTSLIRKRPPLGPHSSPMLRALWCSLGVGRFLKSEGPL